MRNGAEEMIMMRRWQHRQQRFARRPHERLWQRENKRHDPLLCKCLVAMGMYHFVDHFDNFNQFIRMSSDQCRLYGPEFAVKYAKLHANVEKSEKSVNRVDVLRKWQCMLGVCWPHSVN
ncbi:hypothetical protein GBF38_016606 [Nibea albiflora]|uniref:Uncharacterized protein n=1 Tax=Nibea albiflora TaxID=240163 RepID=A0ACB7EV97_NIBAL|nr:hypothetical protein GBF38_016606 [Nibea albiflora]